MVLDELIGSLLPQSQMSYFRGYVGNSGRVWTYRNVSPDWLAYIEALLLSASLDKRPFSSSRSSTRMSTPI